MNSKLTSAFLCFCATAFSSCDQYEQNLHVPEANEDLAACTDGSAIDTCTEHSIHKRNQLSSNILKELEGMAYLFENDSDVQIAHQAWSSCLFERTALSVATPDDLEQYLAQQIAADAAQGVSQDYGSLANVASDCVAETGLQSVYEHSLEKNLSVALANRPESKDAFSQVGLVNETSTPGIKAQTPAVELIELSSIATDSLQHTTRISDASNKATSLKNPTARSSFDSKMTNLNGLVFDLSYSSWKWYAANDSANGKRWHPDFHWGVNECSAPLIGNGPWDFKYACIRHDLSWANLKRIEDDHRRDVWNGRNKNAADLQFKEDLYARCGDFSWYVEWACYPDAELYFSVVNLLPPYAMPWDAYRQGFVW